MHTPGNDTRFNGYFIFSVASPEDFERYALEHNLPVKRVIGRYKGNNEVSFVMQENDIEPIVIAGWLHGEESVLYLRPQKDGMRIAELRYIDGPWFGQTHVLGPWKAVNPQVAKESDAYTYDPLTETYYVAG